MSIASREPRPQSSSRSRFPGLVGRSMAFRQMIHEAETLLAATPPVLLLRGETGTGKALLARAMHEWSRPSGAPFLFLPCDSLPARVIEREIFGPSTDHPAPDAGLLGLAGGGTLVLEDADRLPPRVFTRLRNRPRSSRESDPLVIAITRRTAHEPGGVRELHGLRAPWLEQSTLSLPPLRRRSDDLEPLAMHLLRSWARLRDTPTPALADEAVEALASHPWPGNVRELRIVLEGAATIAPGEQIRAEHLRIRVRDTRPLRSDRDIAPEMIRIPSLGKSWEDIEAEAVEATLRITSWNRSQAARILGVSRPTLTRKIRKYRLTPPDHRD